MTRIPFGDARFTVCLIVNSLIVVGAMSLQVPVSRHLSANTISVCYCLEPVVTAVAAFFLLGERLRPPAWVGVGLILAALVFFDVEPRAPAESEPKPPRPPKTPG